MSYKRKKEQRKRKESADKMKQNTTQRMRIATEESGMNKT